MLSGCGVFDGSEIHEAVIALLNLQKRGVSTEFFAPDTDQFDVVNHLDSIAMQPRRNALVESARIARGKIQPLAKFDAGNFDILLFVGGFGAAKTLCTFASDGADCKVNKHVESAIVAALAKKISIAFMCIAPVIAAKVIGGGVKLTIGNDPSTAAAIEAMGAKHIECQANSFVEDKAKKSIQPPHICWQINSGNRRGSRRHDRRNFKKCLKLFKNCGHPSLYYVRRLRRRQSLPQADKLARLGATLECFPARFQILSFPISTKIAE